MYTLARKSLVWLVAAIYLVDGVLAGAAHFHGHSAKHGAASVQAAAHSHAPCGHHHHRHDSSAATKPDPSAPAIPHEHEDCAACRYSSLSAEPVALVAVPELGLSVASVSARLPRCPATKFVSLHRARAPPSAA